MKIQMNHGIELLCSVRTVAYFEEIKKEMSRDNKKMTPRVSKMVKEINENMSPMMRSDLEYYKNYQGFFGHVLWMYFMKNESSSVEEGFEYLKDLSYVDVLRAFLDCDESSDKLESELIEALKEKNEMKEVISSEGLKEFKKYPQESKIRFIQFLERFYQEYYLPVKDEIVEVLEKKIEKHTLIANNHLEKFVKGVAVVKSEEVLSGELSLHPIISFFFQHYVQLQLDDKSNVLYCVYGLKAEQRFDPKHEEKRRRELFKSLSDETRVKILKALKTGPKYTTELAELVGVSKATVSYHMNRLIILDIVKLCLEKSGRKSHYELNIEAIESYFNGFLDSLKN